MTAPPEPSNPFLPEDVADEIGRQLQFTLVELIALSLAGKQLHWNAYGREFFSVRRHLADVVDEWRELEDVVAERAAALGICPDGSPAAVIELANLRPVDPGFTETGTAIEQMCMQLRDVVLRVRERSEALGGLDAVSQYTLVEVSHKLEQQLWAMRAQLPD